jgi:uncharacterized protein YndB with AHSA1/START domain
MTTATELKLEVSHHYPFPPERVFDAWLDPKMLARMMTPGTGMTVPEARTDPRVGGEFLVVMRRPDGEDLPHSGKYRIIDRAKRLEFTWVSPFSVEGSVVTVDFRPRDGGTELTLRHVRFLNEERRDGHKAGWTMILESLADALA